MVRTIARIVGSLMVANALFDFSFPEAGSQFFTTGPGRKWNVPLRTIVQNVGCLTPTTRRYLAVWEGLAGALLLALANEELTRQEGAAIGRAAGRAPVQGVPGPVRIPIEHIRH